MRIGLIAPPWIPVPPPGYGGTESVVDNLAVALAARRHDIRLFTVGASTCPVTRRHLFPSPVEPMGDVVHEAAHVLAAYDALADVEIIHDHTVIGPLIGARRSGGPPVVTTNHGPFTAEARRIFAAVAETAAVVAISRAQARSAGSVPVAAVIHHGIDLGRYRPGPGDGGYVLFLGRMCADKGVHRALRIARLAGCRLVIVTKMREPDEWSYFEREVRPLLSDRDEMLIEVPTEDRLRLLGGAEALVNPIGWPEPFGLVMIEALASGTPVLSFPNGAAPEIVEHGRTGFLCADEEAMAAALDSVHTIDRGACRAAAERRFSRERMATDYEQLYRSVIAGVDCATLVSS
jgi:glycosyltransferase involved in cell wall biosynthesis